MVCYRSSRRAETLRNRLELQVGSGSGVNLLRSEWNVHIDKPAEYISHCFSGYKRDALLQ